MNWFKDNVAGIFVLAIVAAIAAQVLWGVSAALWRKFNWGKRIANFLATIIKPFALSRLMAHKYTSKKDYFRFIALAVTAIVGFVITSIVFFTVLTLTVVYCMVNGVNVSWSLFVLLSVLVFFFLAWIKDAFYFYGVFEQTIKKDYDKYREILKTLPDSVLDDVINKDLDVLLAPEEKAIKTAIVQQPEKLPDKSSDRLDSNSSSG